MNQHFGKHPCTTPAQATTQRIFAHPNICMRHTPKSFFHSAYASYRAKCPRAPKHAYACVSKLYPPSRFDARTRTRSVRCGRGGDYGEAHPHQIYTNKSRLNTQNGANYEKNGLGERRGTS